MVTDALIRALPRFATVALVAALLSGCGTLYLAQAARGQMQVMRERKPIDRVVTDERTPPALRARLVEVRDARNFASRELGLPDNASYRSYADVGRSYVVWNVVAAPEFSIVPQHWCFPIAGCVSYRGYFSEPQAKKFAANMRARGFDVTVSGVPAYSTLGRIADPVLNTMLRYGDTEIAAIMFHELAHQVVYVAGDSAFNEAFAVTVEQAGLQRWLEKKGQGVELERYAQRRARQRQLIALLMDGRARLARLYASGVQPKAMREEKAKILGDLTERIQALDRQQGGRSPYAAWIAEGLNNAHLASVATYFDCVPQFEKLLSATGNDLPQFYARVREIAGKPRAERRSQLCAGPA